MRSNCMAALQGEWQRDAEVTAGGGGCGSAWSPASTHGARTARTRRGDGDASRDERSAAVRALRAWRNLEASGFQQQLLNSTL